MEIPREIIGIHANEGDFTLSVIAINEGTPESIKLGGVTADINIQIHVDGIKADFRCLITVGNLYAFYSDLHDKYEHLNGEAVLKDHSGELTRIVFGFDKTGKCTICGHVYNGAYSGNKVGFRLTCDQTYINPIIRSLKLLFDEFAELQGYYDFHY